MKRKFMLKKEMPKTKNQTSDQRNVNRNKIT